MLYLLVACASPHTGAPVVFIRARKVSFDGTSSSPVTRLDSLDELPVPIDSYVWPGTKFYAKQRDDACLQAGSS
jgi:hypothetical protein